jgi:hypothetical protein
MATRLEGRFSIRGNPSPLSKSVTVKSKGPSPPKNKIPTPPRISPLLNSPRASISMRARPYGVDKAMPNERGKSGKHLYKETMPTLLTNRGIPIQVMKLGLDRFGYLVVDEIYKIKNGQIEDEDEPLTYQQIEENNQKLIEKYNELSPPKSKGGKKSRKHKRKMTRGRKAKKRKTYRR